MLWFEFTKSGSSLSVNAQKLLDQSEATQVRKWLEFSKAMSDHKLIKPGGSHRIPLSNWAQYDKLFESVETSTVWWMDGHTSVAEKLS